LNVVTRIWRLYIPWENQKLTGKFPPNVTKKLVRAYEVLVSSETIQDLWLFPAYKFESLGKSRYSLRLTIVWRLEMNITWTNSDCTIGIIGLEDLSYHYGG
jgi:proteic killer suppression protein